MLGEVWPGLVGAVDVVEGGRSNAGEGSAEKDECDVASDDERASRAGEDAARAGLDEAEGSRE